MTQDKSNIIGSGFIIQQTEIALRKARIGYDLSNKKNNLRKEVLRMDNIQIAA